MTALSHVPILWHAPCGVVRMGCHNIGFFAIVVLKARYLNIEEANMADSAISNLLRKNVGAGLARVSLNKNIIRNYFRLVFFVDKRAFKRIV